MKKFVTGLVAFSMTAVLVTPALANDNLLARGAEHQGGIQDQYQNRGAKIGLSYTYRFGANVSKSQEWGTLNIRNFRGQDIPVMNFSSDGTAPPDYVLNANGDGFLGMSNMTWVYIIAGAGALVGGYFLLKKDAVVAD